MLNCEFIYMQSLDFSDQECKYRKVRQSELQT